MFAVVVAAAAAVVVAGAAVQRCCGVVGPVWPWRPRALPKMKHGLGIRAGVAVAAMTEKVLIG